MAEARLETRGAPAKFLRVIRFGSIRSFKSAEKPRLITLLNDLARRSTPTHLPNKVFTSQRVSSCPWHLIRVRITACFGTFSIDGSDRLFRSIDISNICLKVALEMSDLQANSPPGQAATRQALLEVAADVFARIGFQNATVREICQRAGANIAAINYHFGDKAGLYSEVLKIQGELAQVRFPTDAGLPDSAPPTERLAAFIRSFLQRVLAEEIANRHGRMMAREMVEPTAALDRLVREVIQPQAHQLHEIVQALLPVGTNTQTVRLCGLSIVGQILFYAHCRPVLSRLEPAADYDFVELDQLSQHITRFSLSALQDYCRSPARTPSRRTQRRRRSDSAQS